jgi:hypothetical protein
MRKVLVAPTVTLSAILVLVACASTSPQGPTGQTQTLGIQQPSAVASVPVASVAPSRSPAPASVPGSTANLDPELAARFPGIIDSQPVTNIRIVRYVQTLRTVGVREAVIGQFTSLVTKAGIDPARVTRGTAEARAKGHSELIQAIRFPGGDGSRFVQALAKLDQQRNGNSEPSPIALTSAVVSGKTVQSVASGATTQYYYATGDTVFVLNADANSAATILAALP